MTTPTEPTVDDNAPASIENPAPKRSNREKRRIFLNHLAATCNVRKAAAAAGAGASYFYGLRRTDEPFAAGWEAAVQAGYDRLEEAVLARALEEMTKDQFDPAAVTLELTAADDAAPPDRAAGGRRPGRGNAGAAGCTETIARVDVQVALAMLNRRAAIERRGRERPFRRPSAGDVEKALNTKLDRLARRVTPLGGEQG